LIINFDYPIRIRRLHVPLKAKAALAATYTNIHWPSICFLNNQNSIGQLEDCYGQRRKCPENFAP
jgi:hypothetical protein